MPSWGLAEGGSLNNQEINNVITFIQYGDWDTTLDQADLAVGLTRTYRPTRTPAIRAMRPRSNRSCWRKRLTCHQIGGVGGRIGAELTDVGSRRTADWLKRWIKNPSAIAANERGPNLWLVGPTPGIYTPAPSGSPTPTAVSSR